MKHYPLLIIDHEALRSNMETVIGWCAKAGIDVAGVFKGTTGMESVALDYESCGAKWIASSRLEQLRRAREAGVKAPLMMIRVPMISQLEEMSELCGYSLQSRRETLDALEGVLAAKDKKHSVILMADLGDLREGIIDKDEFVRTAKHIEEDLPHIHLAGIGTNLGCVGSVVPTKEKMETLVEWAEAVEETIGRQLEIVSGGATSSLMPVIDGVMPPKINQLRIGALVLCGPLEDYRTCYGREEADVLSDEVFMLEAEVIEAGIKPTYPIGELGVNAFGERAEYIDRGDRKRVLLAIGRADYGDIGDIVPMLKGAEVTMASGDHTVLDIEDTGIDLKVGDKVKFKLKYSAILRLTASENVYKEHQKGRKQNGSQQEQ